MHQTYRIRDCTLEDCPAVLDLWREAEAIASHTDTLQQLHRLVGENTGLFLAAEEEGRLVGTIIGGWDGWRGNMYRLAVLPAYRRRGIARALVAEVERRLRARGARRITALVAKSEEQAMAFWQAAGYDHDQRMV
ncbi:MAG: GNAT family N-acetyltransferase, partial [Chloroflexota bacterium]|nr:GNAT family N-acetyltransferase [Chloroflexota bacterium]